MFFIQLIQLGKGASGISTYSAVRRRLGAAALLKTFTLTPEKIKSFLPLKSLLFF